jgi:polyprenyldihydroxybenzoate methyltransferase/3-demethylubiquinol 3-O-methyltransferase
LLLKDTGSVFFTTLTRTTASYLLGIVAAERILGLLPVGTHDWNKFVTPSELSDMAREAGCQTKSVTGMMYWPGLDYWHWMPFTTVNYAVHAIKMQ